MCNRTSEVRIFDAPRNDDAFYARYYFPALAIFSIRRASTDQ
jgi:hypothetical protein